MTISEFRRHLIECKTAYVSKADWHELVADAELRECREIGGGAELPAIHTLYVDGCRIFLDDSLLYGTIRFNRD